MTLDLDPTLLPALNKIYELLERGPAPRHYAAQPEADATDYHVVVLHRELERNAELRRVMGLPRASQPNPADTCSCGAEATSVDYRNGHEYGLCDDCR